MPPCHNMRYTTYHHLLPTRLFFCLATPGQSWYLFNINLWIFSCSSRTTTAHLRHDGCLRVTTVATLLHGTHYTTVPCQFPLGGGGGGEIDVALCQHHISAVVPFWVGQWDLVSGLHYIQALSLYLPRDNGCRLNTCLFGYLRKHYSSCHYLPATCHTRHTCCRHPAPSLPCATCIYLLPLHTAPPPLDT